MHRNDEARCAKAALNSTFRYECLLDVSDLAGARLGINRLSGDGHRRILLNQTFNRDDVGTNGSRSHDQARTNSISVH